MIILQSVIVCDAVQELANENLNYINITNEFWGLGIAGFDLAIRWIFDKEAIYKEEVFLTSPSGKVIAVSEKAIPVNGYFFTSIIRFEVDFEEAGVYYVDVKIQGESKMKFPLIVYQE